MNSVATTTTSTEMMAGIMLIFCIQYKYSGRTQNLKTTYNLYRVSDFGPHTELIFGGATYTVVVTRTIDD